jgi:hypothetical protein
MKWGVTCRMELGVKGKGESTRARGCSRARDNLNGADSLIGLELGLFCCTFWLGSI